jgi:hypothetical protein
MLQRHFAPGFAIAALLAATTLSAAEDNPPAPVRQPAAEGAGVAQTPESAQAPQSAQMPESARAPDSAQTPDSTQTADNPPGSVQAIWKQQQINFYFTSFTTRYACTSLENRIEQLLKALGARAQVRVRSPECPHTVATMPRVTIDVTSPVEATEAAIAERDKNKSTRELAARVQGKSPEEIEGMDQFAAQWKRLSLSRGKLGLEPGDCELIDELRRKVLPKLSVRLVDSDVQCTPHQLSISQPRLEVEALVALPKPDEKEKPKEPKLELNLRTE